LPVDLYPLDVRPAHDTTIVRAADTIGPATVRVG
jgi:hypothetical protein